MNDLFRLDSLDRRILNLSIPEITSTETFISLEEGFTRQLPVEQI